MLRLYWAALTMTAMMTAFAVVGAAALLLIFLPTQHSFRHTVASSFRSRLKQTKRYFSGTSCFSLLSESMCAFNSTFQVSLDELVFLLFLSFFDIFSTVPLLFEPDFKDMLIFFTPQCNVSEHLIWVIIADCLSPFLARLFFSLLKEQRCKIKYGNPTSKSKQADEKHTHTQRTHWRLY